MARDLTGAAAGSPLGVGSAISFLEPEAVGDVAFTTGTNVLTEARRDAEVHDIWRGSRGSRHASSAAGWTAAGISPWRWTVDAIVRS